MWLSFSIGIVVCIALLYAPGFFLFRAMGFDGLHSLVLAPIASALSYIVLGITFSRLGIFCTWVNIVLPVFVLYLLLFVVRVLVKRDGDSNEPVRTQVYLFPARNWPTLALYICAGIAVVVYVYVLPLGSPEHFIEGYDNAFHMMVVRGFSDSGIWSMLDVSKYMTSADASIMPMPDSGFYPALWHLVCSLVMSVMNCSVPFSVNVVNVVMAGVLFPSSMMLFISTILFRASAVRLGALCAPAFVGFPWMLLYWGPLYPNALSFAIAPLAATLFINGINALVDGSMKLRIVIAFFLSVFDLVVAQTSTVFFCIALLAPYCVYRLWTLDRTSVLKNCPLSNRALSLLFVAFVVLVWTGFVFAPFMRSTVFEYNWASVVSVNEACMAVLRLEDGWIPAQYVLAVIVLMGIVSAARHRKLLWLVVPYFFFAIVFVLCASTEGFVKHYLGGFWYTDAYRLFACLVIVGVPLAAQGLSAILIFLQKRLNDRVLVWRIVVGALSALFCVLVYRPGIWMNGSFVDSAFGKIRWEFTQGNDHDRPNMLSSEEERFLKEVADIVPEGSLIVNMPDDGSAFAYATDGLRTYYREYRVHEGVESDESSKRFETLESELIRKHANTIAANAEVQAAFETIGAQYVLILDYGDALERQPMLPTFDMRHWEGIAGITDETPGFSLVLSEGDMRLYRVDM